MAKKTILVAVMFLFSIAISACSHIPKNPDASLYDQLGQYEGIDNIVRELIYVIAEDERVKERYRGVNMNKFKKGLSDYICVLAHGPCQYAGDSMQQIHAGHQYTNTEFNAIVGDLIKAMERKKIPVTTQNKLLSALASSYGDVVYH
jgi:hemoglobin